MGDKANIILLVLMGSMVMFLLIMVIITFSVMYSRRMQEKDAAHKIEMKNLELSALRSVLEAEETERDRMASGIHDELGPLLSSLKLALTESIKKHERGTLTTEFLTRNRDAAGDASENIRSVCHALSPQYLNRYGLCHAIENFTQTVALPKIKIVTELTEAQLKISNTARNQVYCILLELINNVMKHDGARKMQIYFEKIDKDSKVTLKHNGVGITTEEFETFKNEPQGLGLLSIQTRIVVINGILEFAKGELESTIVLRFPSDI
ncbi:MAG: histidine kinase [Crocinitomicaceae bacterium]|nr:histidine kinase [Crocinitomicaceae bacterium]